MGTRDDRQQAGRQGARKQLAHATAVQTEAKQNVDVRRRSLTASLASFGSTPARSIPPRFRPRDAPPLHDLKALLQHFTPTVQQSELPHRTQLERQFATSLSDVAAFLGVRKALTPLHAEAAAEGNLVAFAEKHPPYERVAHEIVHVLQARRSTGGGAPEMEAREVESYVRSGVTRRIHVTAMARGIQRDEEDQAPPAKVFDAHAYIRERASRLPHQLWGTLEATHVVRAATSSAALWGPWKDVSTLTDKQKEELGAMTLEASKKIYEELERQQDLPGFYEQLVRGMTADPTKEQLEIDDVQLAALLSPHPFEAVVAGSALPSDSDIPNSQGIRSPILWDITNAIAQQLLESIPRMIPRCFGKKQDDWKSLPVSHPLDRAVGWVLCNGTAKDYNFEPIPHATITTRNDWMVNHPSVAGEAKRRPTKPAEIQLAGPGLWHWFRATDPAATVEDVALTLFNEEAYAHLLLPAPPLFAWQDRDWDRIDPDWRKVIADAHPNKILTNPRDFDRGMPCNVGHHKADRQLKTMKEYDELFATLAPPPQLHAAMLGVDDPAYFRMQAFTSVHPTPTYTPIYKIPPGDAIAELNGKISGSAIGTEDFADSRPKTTVHDHLEIVALLLEADDVLHEIKDSAKALELPGDNASECLNRVRERRKLARGDELVDVDHYWSVFDDQVRMLGQIAYGLAELRAYVEMYATPVEPTIKIFGVDYANPLANVPAIKRIPDLVRTAIGAAATDYDQALAALDLREIAHQRLGVADATTRNLPISITEDELREIAPGVDDAIKNPDTRHPGEFDANAMKARGSGLREQLGILRIGQLHDPFGAAQELSATQGKAGDLQFEATVVSCLTALAEAWRMVDDQEDFWSSMYGVIRAEDLKAQNDEYHRRFLKDVYVLYTTAKDDATKQKARDNFKALANADFRNYFELVKSLIKEEAKYKRWAKLAVAIAITIVSMGAGAEVGAFLAETAMWGRTAVAVGSAVVETGVNMSLSKIILNQPITKGAIFSQLGGNALTIGVLQKFSAVGRAAGLAEETAEVVKASMVSRVVQGGLALTKKGVMEGTMGLLQGEVQHRIDEGNWIPADQIPDMLVDQAVTMIAVSLHERATATHELKKSYARIDRKLGEVYDERIAFEAEANKIAPNDRGKALELVERMRKNYQREAALHEARARAKSAGKERGVDKEALEAKSNADRMVWEARKQAALIAIENVGPNMFRVDPRALDSVLALQRENGGKVVRVSTDTLGLRIIEIQPAAGPPIKFHEKMLAKKERIAAPVPSDLAAKFEAWFEDHPTVLAPGHSPAENAIARQRLLDYYVRDPAGALAIARDRMGFSFEGELASQHRDAREDALALGDARGEAMLPADFAAMEHGGFHYDPVARSFVESRTASGAGAHVDPKLKERSHEVVGQPVHSLAVAKEVARILAMGDAHALRVLGIEPPPGFNSTHTEWGVGRRKNAHGEYEYVIVRGDLTGVDWGKVPGVEPYSHTHPFSDSKYFQIGGTKDGTVTVHDLINGLAEGELHKIFPSGADLVYIAKRKMGTHDVITPYVFLGLDASGSPILGNPRPGGLEAPVEFEIVNARTLDGSDAIGTAYATAEIVMKIGEKEVWRGQMTGGQLGNYMPVHFGDRPPKFIEGAAPATPDSTATAAREVSQAKLKNAIEKGQLPKELKKLLGKSDSVANAFHNMNYSHKKLREAWDAWTQHRDPSALKSKTFEEYLQNTSAYRTTLDLPSPKLTEVFPHWDRLTLEQKQTTVFEDAEPGLHDAVYGDARKSALPKDVRAAIKKALSDASSPLLTDVTVLAGAREQVLGRINEIIGAGISSPAELVAVLRLADSSGTIGAIGEAYVDAKLVSELHAKNDRVLPSFTADEIPGLEDVNVFRPDRVIGDANRTLDVKTGYANSQIDLAQARNYKRLRDASKRSKKLRDQLGGAAVVGHDYLFLQGADPSKSAKEVAAREYDRLKDNRLLTDTRVLYQGPDGKIYEHTSDGKQSAGYATIHAAMGLNEQ